MTSGKGRIVVVAAVLLAALVVLLVHLGSVMLVAHDTWLVRSCRNRWAFRDVPVQRGAILDREGVVLAADQPAWSLWLDPPRFLRGHPLGLADTLLATLALEVPVEPAEALHAALSLKVASLGDPSLGAERSKRAREIAQALLRAVVPRGVPGSETPALQAAFRAARGSERRLVEVVPPALRAATAARYEAILARLLEVRKQVRDQGGADLAALAAGVATLPEARQQAQVRIARKLRFESIVELLRELEAWPGFVCLPTVERKRFLPGRTGLLSLETILGRAQPFAGADDALDSEMDKALLATNRAFANLPDFEVADDADDPDALTDFAGVQARSALLAYYRRSGRFGGTGVEAACDDVLAGTPGLRWIERNARAQERRLFASFDVVPGKDVRLTLDAHLQGVLEEVLDGVAMTEVGECGLTLIDAESGEILALGGRPLADAEGRPWWASPAIAWSGPGDLGSVAKPFVLLEHLDSLRHGRPCTPPTEFVPCTRDWPPQGRQGRHLKCETKHLERGLDPIESLARSCNYWFFQAACGLGEQGVSRAFQRVGLLPHAERPELCQRAIPGMLDGAGFPHRFHNPAEIEQRAIGYGLEAGTLRVARAYAALATGMLPSLSLVLGAPRSPVPLECSREDLDIVLAGMRRCVLPGGTAAAAKTLARLGGHAKTGTAEISATTRANNAWLAGFLPGAQGRTLAFAAALYGVPDKTHGGDAAARLVEAFLERIEGDPVLRAAWLGTGSGR